MIAKTSMVLNSYAIPANKTAVKPTISPFISETTLPVPAETATPKTKIEVPAFEALAATAAVLFVRYFIRR
jgi:hypothetical protein